MNLKKLLFLPFTVCILAGCTPLSGETEQNSFGTTVQVGKIEYCVNRASNTKHVGSEYFGDDTDNNFVIVNITVTNTDNSEVSLLGKMMILHMGKNEYEPHSAAICLDDGFYVAETIGAGLRKTYNVLYETLSTYDSDTYLEVKASSYSTKTANIYFK